MFKSFSPVQAVGISDV